jgi:hypothetical protein
MPRGRHITSESQQDSLSSRGSRNARLLRNYARHCLGSATVGPCCKQRAVAHAVEIDLDPVAGVHLVRSYEIRKRMHHEPFNGALQVTSPVSMSVPCSSRKRFPFSRPVRTQMPAGCRRRQHETPRRRLGQQPGTAQRACRSNQ